jgi:DNA-binding PadR family transcriptional regulator
MRSTVNAAVLSLVIEMPGGSGQLGRRFEDRFFGLQGSGRQHVYVALERLEGQGLVERGPFGDEDEGFRATRKGVSAYREWLRAPIFAGPNARREVMTRLAATRRTDIETGLALLEVYEAVVLAEARRERLSAAGDDVMVLLAAEERRAMADASLRWINSARATLRELAAKRPH